MGWATTVSCVSGINSSLLSSNNYRQQARLISKTITKLDYLASVNTINNDWQQQHLFALHYKWNNYECNKGDCIKDHNQFVRCYLKINDHVYEALRDALEYNSKLTLECSWIAKIGSWNSLVSKQTSHFPQFQRKHLSHMYLQLKLSTLCKNEQESQFSLKFRHIKVQHHQKASCRRTFQDNNATPDKKTWEKLSDICHLPKSHSTVH